jgi:hypothetical protein
LHIPKETNYFAFQSAFMNDNRENLQTLRDIRQMMEKSSRFISLSGLSGIAAGICALIGAGFAYRVIQRNYFSVHNLRKIDEWESSRYSDGIRLGEYMGDRLMWIGGLTFIAAFISAFLFTYLRSRKTGVPVWGASSKRLLVNTAVPLLAGGIYLLHLVAAGTYGLVAPGCLVFYGLALISGSKYTLGDIRYLGYCQLVLGLISLWFQGYGLYFWAAGFGVLHIVYGTLMWWKYERKPQHA